MTSYQKRSAPSPHREILDPVAAALGKNLLEIRGLKVSTFIYDLIETNAHENRRRLSSICARIDISTLMLDTLFRGETDDYLDDSEDAAAHVLNCLEDHQKTVDMLRVRCERSRDTTRLPEPQKY